MGQTLACVPVAYAKSSHALCDLDLISEARSFRSYSRSVRSFRPDFWGESFRSSWGGSFRPYFIGGSFRSDFWGESFRPDLFLLGKQVRKLG